MSQPQIFLCNAIYDIDTFYIDLIENTINPIKLNTVQNNCLHLLFELSDTISQTDNAIIIKYMHMYASKVGFRNFQSCAELMNRKNKSYGIMKHVQLYKLLDIVDEKEKGQNQEIMKKKQNK